MCLCENDFTHNQQKGCIILSVEWRHTLVDSYWKVDFVLEGVITEAEFPLTKRMWKKKVEEEVKGVLWEHFGKNMYVHIFWTGVNED